MKTHIHLLLNNAIMERTQYKENEPFFLIHTGQIQAYKEILKLQELIDNKTIIYHKYYGIDITQNNQQESIKFTAYVKNTFIHDNTLQGIKKKIKNTINAQYGEYTK